jgi:predicted alpha/beta-fold hydrolase
VQTIFSSIGPRRSRVRKQYERFRQNEEEIILNCQDGIRLSGLLNRSEKGDSQQMAILIHGWEGSAESSYMVSMTNRLLESGVDVFRLNMRDHGETHHLNKGIFDSTRVPELIAAVEDLQSRFPYPNTSLIGFSLGGNFALRVAALSHDHQVSLDKVLAFCPTLHASSSNVVLNTRANFIYGYYFVRKWKRSLFKKLVHFPEYTFGDDLLKMKTLNEMNEKFIPEFTEYENVEEYFSAYAITGNTLENTICPCYLHFSKDDMIIPYQDVEQLADNPDLHVTLTEKGGHCGFLMNWRFESWQDERTLELLSA